MSMQATEAAEAVEAAVTTRALNNKNEQRHRWWHSARAYCWRGAKFSFFRMPLFAYFLLLFVLIKLNFPDVRAVVLSGKYYAFSWIDILYVIAMAIGMIEMLRVSKPGVDNTGEAIAMAAIAVVYLVLFVLATSGQPYLQVFRNTEFVMFIIIAGIQSVIAFRINSRTLVRTIDNTSMASQT